MLAIAAGVVLVIVAVVAIVLITGDDGDSPGTADGGASLADVLTDEQRALLDTAVPSADCPDEPVATPDDDSLVALDVLRIDGDCLVATTEYVAADEVDARRSALSE